jgi:Tfp pilus assembly protein PilF/uncharacterized coiled-coil protein SlyX
VYFETGEVVSALSEWVISKNIQPEENIASEYIENLQKDANRLDIINQTIKKYNIALDNCNRGNEDVAEIQLKKILAQNPKLIKGYHLLALLYIRKGEYEKARKLLKKAIRIDKTNTTTLRFLREVDEQTGTATTLEPHFPIWGNRAQPEKPEDDPETADAKEAGDAVIQPPAFRDTSVGITLLNIILGILIGAACVWFLFMPARTQTINQEANEKVAQYSSQMSTQTAEIERLNEQIATEQDTVDTANTQIDEANAKANTYQNLLKAVNALNNKQYDVASNALASVDTSYLTVESKAVYDSIYPQVSATLLAQYKAAGIAAFNAQNYATAITNLELAKKIDAKDYDVLNYLAHSYRLSGDTASADANFQAIITLFPGTKKAENAKTYLSTASASSTAAGTEAATASAALPADTAATASAAEVAPETVSTPAAGTAAGTAAEGNTGTTADTAAAANENTAAGDTGADNGNVGTAGGNADTGNETGNDTNQ